MVAFVCFLIAAYFIIAYMIGGATLLAIAFSFFLYYILWSGPKASKNESVQNAEENLSDLSDLSDTNEVAIEQTSSDAIESIPTTAEPIITEAVAENPIGGDFCAVSEETSDFESTSGFNSGFRPRFSSAFDFDLDSELDSEFDFELDSELDSEFDLDLDSELDSELGLDLNLESDSWDNSWESGSIPRDQSPYWDIDDPYERGAMETRDSMQWWDTFSGDSFGDSFDDF